MSIFRHSRYFSRVTSIPVSLSRVLLLISITGIAGVLCVYASTGAPARFPRQAQENLLLVVGKPVERYLEGGDSHRYRIEISGGHYARILVDQKGIDVVVTLRDPDGKELVQTDGPFGDKGIEAISFIADRPGVYALEIRVLAKTASRGRYEVSLLETRPGLPEDASRISAERIAREALHLFEERTPISNKRAFEKFKEALALFQAIGDRDEMAACLFFTGVLDRVFGDLPAALKQFEEALSICRDMGDQILTAGVLRETAKVLLNQRNNPKALDYYHLAIAFSASIGDHREQAEGLNDIGWVYKAANEYQRAIEYFQQARTISQYASDSEMEGTALNNLALTYIEVSESQKALDCLLQALPLKRRSGHKQGEGVILNGIGCIYQQLCDYQKALDYFNQALPLWRGVDNGRYEAIALHGIGSSYLELADYDKALEYLTRALELERMVKDRASEAATLMSLSSLSFRLGKHAAALEYDKTALEIYRRMGNAQREAVALNRVAWDSNKLGDVEGARQMLSRVISLADGVGDVKELASALNALAHVEYEAGDYASARTHIESALGIIESIRGRIASRDIRTSYFASVRQYYKFYIDLLMRLHQLHPGQGYDRAAFQANERGLARNLLEALKEPYSEVRRGVDAELLERERTLKRQLNAKGEEQIRMLAGKHTDQQAAAVRWEIEALITELQALQGQMRVQSPRYAGLTQPASLTLDQIQRDVLDPNTLLLEYALGERRAYLWAITKHSMISFEVGDSSEIDARAREVYRLLTERNNKVRFETEEERRSRIARADADYDKAATILSRTLLGHLPGNYGRTRLLIVADETLQYLPFAALPDPIARSQPLIRRHEVVSLPSASTLALIRRETRGRATAPKQIAIIGDPVYDNSDVRLKARMPGLATRTADRADERVGEVTFTNTAFAKAESLSASSEPEVTNARLSFTRLNFTRQEAAAVASLAHPEDVMLALDFEANREMAMDSRLAQYRIIHFAAHGLLDTQAPDRSAVVLSLVDEQGGPKNGFLRLHDIYDLSLPAELVVLSACQTALGKHTSGEGLIGLTRGFMYAGSRRVMASLWKVADRATAELMKVFYTATLEKRKSPAAALRAAQIALRKNSNWRAPFFWASFTLQGEYQ